MRCKGTTKSGARCKRNTSEDSQFCRTHVDQATESAPESATESEADIFGSEQEAAEGSSDELWRTLAEVALVGTVVVAALVFGRWIRVA